MSVDWPRYSVARKRAFGNADLTQAKAGWSRFGVGCVLVFGLVLVMVCRPCVLAECKGRWVVGWMGGGLELCLCEAFYEELGLLVGVLG